MLQVEVLEGWTYVRIPAGFGMGDMLNAISRAPNHADRNLLIDASAIYGQDPTGHALLGEHMASKLSQARKIAVLVPEDVVSYNSERAARRKGADLRVFTQRADAERWLAA